MDFLASFYMYVIIVVAMLAIPVVFSIAFRRVVDTNQVHIVQSAKKTVAYGRGKEAGNTYWAWPSWVPLLGIKVIVFPESIFQVSLNDYQAYDKARLPFITDVVAFLRVDEAEVVAQRVANFDELYGQLKAVLQGSVRRVLATNELEVIMESRASLGEQFTAEVEEQLKEWGVLPVKTIEFMDLRDAPESRIIRNIMDKERSRIEMESRVRVSENTRSAELSEVANRTEVEVRRQEAEQQVGIRTAEKEREIGLASEQSAQEVLSLKKETRVREMDVLQVESVREAQISREVAQVEAEKERSITQTRAQAQADVQKINAEAQSKVVLVNAEAAAQVQMVAAQAQADATTLNAEAQLVATTKDAEGLQAQGLARAAAEEAILQAPVTAQITLAKEIGENAGYQAYLIQQEQIRANVQVGMAMASALGQADLKILANASTVQEGIDSFSKVLSANGGFKLGSLVEGFSQTDAGKAFMSKLMSGKLQEAAIAAE